MKAAFYESDITPPLGCFLEGSGMRDYAEDVYEKLYAKAAVIENDGEIAVIIVVDTCSIPDGMHDFVTKRINEYTGIAPERVMLTSNHTHKGAPVLDWPAIGSFGDPTYKDVFFRVCADAAILAYKRLDEAEVKFGTGEVSDISFNRTFITNEGKYVTWCGGRDDIKETLGPIDPSLAVLTFERDGKPIGSIINFACHQDCLGRLLGYSGDYSAVMANHLKDSYGRDFVSLFVLGTCGDINHLNPDQSVEQPPFWYREMGKKLADEAKRVIANSKETSKDVAVVKEKVRLERRKVDEAYVKEAAKKYLDSYAGTMRASNILYYYAIDAEKYDDAYVQSIKIGDVCIYGLPGEVFVEIGLKIKEKSPFKNNMVVELCNGHVPGYIPTKEVFCENSDLYETSLGWGSGGCYVPETGNILAEKALDIGRRLKSEV